ncbi:MAG: putative Fe-S oxidoreductase [Labilithrix sp.]|nr:putative Fe-S oxidoreductase [Labilithrix sp.]
MVGERANADSEPELLDDEEGGESTVAMVSPAFEPSGMPSPISEPPPPLPITPPEGVHGSPLGSQMHTAPVPFTPSGSTGPAVPPQIARPKVPSSPMVPTPLGGLTPSAALPSAPLSTPNAGPSSVGVAGAARSTGPRRPQTVIGLAPPPAGAPRPAAPAAPRPPLLSGAGAAPRPGALSAPNASAPASRPGGAPPIPASSPRQAPPSPGRPWPTGSGGSKEDAPTMMGATEQSLAMFDLDAGAADAARAAVSSPGRPPPPSGRGAMANVAFTPGPPPLPAADEIPKLSDPIDGTDEESTRAVPREELLRAQDAHVVVGADAGGDDATLAVGPGDNEANSKHLAALAQTMTADPEMGFPPPPGMFGQHPQPPMGAMPPPHNMPPPQQGWAGPASASMQQPGMTPPSNPHMPASNPHMHAGMPQSGHMMAPHMGGMPMHQQHPMGYPGAQHGPGPMHAPPGMWAPQQQLNAANAANAANNKSIKVSGQLILLAVVGVICLAIFITGIVLFATTKF